MDRYSIVDDQGIEYTLELRDGALYSLQEGRRTWHVPDVRCVLPLAEEADLHTLIACEIPIFGKIRSTPAGDDDAKIGPFVRFSRLD